MSGRSRDAVGQDLIAVINSMASPGKVRIVRVLMLYWYYKDYNALQILFESHCPPIGRQQNYF